MIAGRLAKAGYSLYNQKMVGMRRSVPFLVAIMILPSYSRADKSFVKSKTYLLGQPASFKLIVRPLKEAEIVGQGMDFPEWLGKFEIRSAQDSRAPHLYSSEPISGLEFSTAEFITDLLPSSKCLWIVYKAYGWSSPHCTSLNGELFEIADGKLLPIWHHQLLEKCTGAGVGSKTTSEYKFSSTKDGEKPPTIVVTNKTWADTWEEIEHPPSQPKRVLEELYVLWHGKFGSYARSDDKLGPPLRYYNVMTSSDTRR